MAPVSIQIREAILILMTAVSILTLAIEVEEYTEETEKPGYFGDKRQPYRSISQKLAYRK